jgi:hypothetical protein
MSGEYCRFLHASDLHLEQPLYGLTEVPDQLRDQLIEAPLQAASRLFETAILEDVDFVILAGDVIDPRSAGPYALAFLLEQFELLREQKIHVYWCGGRADPAEAWPEEVPLPDHVHRFPRGKVGRFVHRRGEVPIASVIGISAAGEGLVQAGEFRTDPANIFTVAIAHGRADSGSLAAHKHIDYWALGGRHEANTLFQGQATGQYCGSPQGRRPDEVGTHGCTLVQVDHARKSRTKFIATDVVRWRTESLSLAEDAHRNDLQRQLRSSMQRIAAEAAGCTALVSWHVQAGGTLGRSLRNGELGRELIEWLRTEFGRAKPAVWTTSLNVEAAEPIPDELYEEDTILGDFLRAVRDHERDPSQTLNFGTLLPDLSKDRSLATALGSVDSQARQTLLQEAAELGVDLLSGEEAR